MNLALRQNLIAASFLAFLPLVFLISGLLSAGVIDTWIDFPPEMLAILPTYVFVCSLCSGVIQHLSELHSPLREWVLHRGISRKKLFGMRAGANLVVLGLGYPLAITVVALAHRSFTQDGDLVNLDRFLELIALSTVAFSGYAFGVWTVVPHGGFFRSILTSLVIGIAIVMCSLFILTPDVLSAGSSPLAFAAFHLTVAAALLWSISQRFLMPIELDRPTSMRDIVVTETTVTIAVGSLLVLGIGRIQAGFDPAARYPRIVESAARGPVLMTNDLHGSGAVVDAEHRVGERLFSNWQDRTLFDPRAYIRCGVPELQRGSAAWTRLLSSEPVFGEERTKFSVGIPFSIWLRKPSGRVEFLLRHSVDSHQVFPGASTHAFLEKPTGRFSNATEIIQSSQTAESPSTSLVTSITSLIGDPEDGSLWLLRCAGNEPVLERVEIPNGDRMVRVIRAGERDWFDGPNSSSDPQVIGEKARYRFAQEKLIEVGPPLIATRYAVRIESFGEYGEFRVIVEDVASGAIALSHDYEARTADEKDRLLLTRALAVLRPPALSIAAHLSGGESATDSFSEVIASDPLLRSGRGRTLVVSATVIALLLAAFAARRLRKLGAERTRILYWSLLILASGPIGFLVYRVSERDRAWDHPEESSDEVALLIRSVA